MPPLLQINFNEIFEIDDGTGKIRVDDDSQDIKDYYNPNIGANPLLWDLLSSR